MARSKNKTNNKGTDGKRKETKEERRARLESTAEAREECMKWLPIAGGVLLVILLMFGVWVRSVPPIVIKLEKPSTVQGGGSGGMPEFMMMDTEPVVITTTESNTAGNENVDEKLQAIKDPLVETIEF